MGSLFPVPFEVFMFGLSHVWDRHRLLTFFGINPNICSNICSKILGKRRCCDFRVHGLPTLKQSERFVQQLL
jgi:hypothetical protein